MEVMINCKSLLTILLLILLGTLIACGGPDPSPSDDILAPLPTNSDGSSVDSGGEANNSSSAGSDSNTAAENNASLPTLLELLSEDLNLIFFANGVNNVGLADELQSGGPYTVFAASNLAFTRSELIVSQMDPALLGSVLDTHVVEGAYLRADLTQAGSVTALDGYALPIREPEGMLIVDYALVDGEPIQASNGVLYVINTLLLSPETGPEKSMWGILQADGRFTTFVSILEGGEFMTDLRFKDNYDAIVAPTDEAFANMPANVTTWLENNPHDYEFVAFFHLLSPDGWPQGTDLTVADMVELGSVQTRIGVSGSGFGFGFEELPVSQTESGVTIGGAQIIEGDIDASNGIVHAIDTVLIPQALMDHIEE
jgi:uncharacterized surface protein with fasciclin (FAS1) repeats